MRRLCLVDYLGLRAICSPWRSTVANAIANKHCHPLPELPLVVLQSVKSCTFFSLSTGRVLCPKRPLFVKMQICHGSVEGWMIMSEYANVGSLIIFFFNPVTNARIWVPSLLSFPTKSPLQANLFMGKMVASSIPHHSSNSFLVGLFNDRFHITFCKLFDKSWTTIEADKDTGVRFVDVEIIDRKLFVATGTSSNLILVYDLQDSSNGPPRPKVIIMLPPRPPTISSMFGNENLVEDNVHIHLAKDHASGELFLIYTFYDSVHETRHVGYLNMVTEYVIPPQIFNIEVFKLDTRNENNKWMKVDNLGDRVLFLSGYKSMVMSRAALNSTEELITGNSIFFAMKCNCPEDPWAGLQIGMICLTDNSIKYFSVEKSSPFIPYPTWFVPGF
ncbi:uncharacterized protein LOC133300836 [Gastrolobium bilobum]|uniref:uncharacterized protein LOC133300836 n=1 Tax=Gastrolobium bilobum TaxID=150636 RepID=UPI002AB25022|nr:uncharacterized protein LOC133300836 [Gastrolobium bilobum]